MNLSDGVQISEALVITLFSMGLVFVTLLVISYCIDGLRIAFHKDSSQKKTEKVQPSPVKPVETIKAEPEQEDEELIAVITAAIASSVSRATSDIIVRNIRRVPQNTPTWARVGRQEQFNLK